MPDTENSREDFAVTLSPAGLKPNDWNRYLRRLALKEHQAMKSSAELRRRLLSAA